MYDLTEHLSHESIFSINRDLGMRVINTPRWPTISGFGDDSLVQRHQDRLREAEEKQSRKIIGDILSELTHEVD